MLLGCCRALVLFAALLHARQVRRARLCGRPCCLAAVSGAGPASHARSSQASRAPRRSVCASLPKAAALVGLSRSRTEPWPT